MARAICFGLDYSTDPKAALKGCKNDAIHMSEYFSHVIPGIECHVFTDDEDAVNTSANGMLLKLQELASDSFLHHLDFVLIHYSGHGVSVKDYSGDEPDGLDECLVPSDFRKSGFILDDALELLFSTFNPHTRVLCVFDCCHSGTICDLKYSWVDKDHPLIENKNSNVHAKILAISGCKDDQVSLSTYNINNDKEFGGALTSLVLQSLRETPELRHDVFELVKVVTHKLKLNNMQQLPKITSSYDLRNDKAVF
jgi:hypothetical protein